MGRELDFFCYTVSFVNVPTYLPTLCKREINPWRQHEIYHDRLLADISFSPYIQKMEKINVYRTVPEENIFFFSFHQNIPYEYPLLEGMPHEYMYPGILLLLLLPP